GHPAVWFSVVAAGVLGCSTAASAGAIFGADLSLPSRPGMTLGDHLNAMFFRAIFGPPAFCAVTLWTGMMTGALVRAAGVTRRSAAFTSIGMAYLFGTGVAGLFILV
ncbi:MAG: hypothetical protein AAF907_02720, partial [Planctomycetota bacterium]